MRLMYGLGEYKGFSSVGDAVFKSSGRLRVAGLGFITRAFFKIRGTVMKHYMLSM